MTVIEITSKNLIFIFKLILCTIIVIILTYYQVQKTNINEIEDFFKEIENKIDKPDTNLTLIQNIGDKINRTSIKRRINMKYILQWTSPKIVPLECMGKGRELFFRHNCRFKNCFVTSQRDFLGHYTKFHALMFHAPELLRLSNQELPTFREPNQKYVFVSIESSDYYPICTERFDKYFNWVWSHRLGSDSEWNYFVVRDKKGKVVGPKKDMHWLKWEEMKPVKTKLRNQLQKKTKFAVWFVSNCYSLSKREVFINDLNKELLKSNTEYQIDIIGSCGTTICDRDDWKYCDSIIERDYYFYMAFENSFSEDYVTEKVLHALEYKTIPVVFGAANYTRFMPDGSYLNARELGIKPLALKMIELRNDIDKYVEYFRWKNHYVFENKNSNPDTDYFCHICKLLNDESKMKDNSVHENLQEWWDPPDKC